MNKINILIVGAGHYSTGSTVLSGKKTTDKDLGILLPSVLALHDAGMVGKIGVAARDGSKLLGLPKKIETISNSFDCNNDLMLYPRDNNIDDLAYKKAMLEMPKPCIVLIAVPDNVHLEVMSCCIENALPFMIVKPAVTNLDDLYKLLDKLEKNPVLAMVDYHKVYDDANIILKNEYQSGAYGKLQHFSSLMTQRRDMLEIYGSTLNSLSPPNINHYLGSHYIHMVGFITKATPLDVRATAQMGVAEKMLKRDGVADIIETQVRWKGEDGSIFTSYHVSGWSDPSETESMTYQEVHLLCEKGHIDSDQRYRGFRKVISGEGYSAPNPYFFGLDSKDGLNLINNKYGFISIKTFVENCININEGKIMLKELDSYLPTLQESEKVTAILEAADKSLANNSKVIELDFIDKRYCCIN